MRIKCTECHSKAIISSRNELDPKVADLYCMCANPECGASFVMKLSYSHTLSPSRSQAHSMAVELLRGLPAAEQLDLLQQARAAG
ncbi:ogr/Delta-like zinc finger family protein [Microbulbifer taiwanensis]|uniref:Ogr/Delta-like zinc finger family protein n=1 Tax=Microbulbifer taiwanensis TaxID=986746 RepID=A0ABW1YPN4_9GAMM|nr:ogr/Delta-like zinc finger family protein [Microbulbifer taiwanensis]